MGSTDGPHAAGSRRYEVPRLFRNRVITGASNRTRIGSRLDRLIVDKLWACSAPSRSSTAPLKCRFFFVPLRERTQVTNIKAENPSVSDY
jgi:hypothetical protein